MKKFVFKTTLTLEVPSIVVASNRSNSANTPNNCKTILPAAPNHFAIPQDEWIASIKEILSHGMFSGE